MSAPGSEALALRFPACMRGGRHSPRGSLGSMGRQLAGAWMGSGSSGSWASPLQFVHIEVAWDVPDEDSMRAIWDTKGGRRGALLRVEGRKVADWTWWIVDANLERAMREALEQDGDRATRLLCSDARGPVTMTMWGLPPWLMVSAIVAGAFVSRIAPGWHVPADIPEVAAISHMFSQAAVAAGGVDHWPFLEAAISIHPLGLEGMVWARLDWDRALIWADFVEENTGNVLVADRVRSLHAFADLEERAKSVEFYVVDHRAEGLLYPIGIPQDPRRDARPAPKPILIHGAPGGGHGSNPDGLSIIKGNSYEIMPRPTLPSAP